MLLDPLGGMGSMGSMGAWGHGEVSPGFHALMFPMPLSPHAPMPPLPLVHSRLVRRIVMRRTDRQPVGADAIPFLQHEALGFEEVADARRLPADDVLENRHEHARRIV